MTTTRTHAGWGSAVPIPFTPEMVAAIRAGRKTETRRPWTAQPPTVHPEEGWLYCWDAPAVDAKGVWWLHHGLRSGYQAHKAGRCRYGQAGQFLYVTERWSTLTEYERTPGAKLPADAPIWYAADGPKPDGFGRWRPGMFLQRRFARILLHVKGIAAEQVQQITEAAAIAEGVLVPATCSKREREPARGAYRELWDRINAERGLGWTANPWAWVVRFEVVEMP